MSQDHRFYVVRGRASHGVIKHRCPTVEFALDSLRRFTREKMADIGILDPDGVPMTLGDLEALGTQGTAFQRDTQIEPV